MLENYVTSQSLRQSARPNKKIQIKGLRISFMYAHKQVDSNL